MPWTQISPGHWQRAIGENETFIKIIGDPGHALGHEHWAINADAVINPKPSDEAIKRFEHAWKALRFHHPSIAAVASDSHIDYIVPDAQQLEQWAAETFTVTRGTSREDVAASIKPISSAALYLFPETGEVLLHTSHWRTDGIGVLQLLNAYLELAASPASQDPANLPWGEETSRLAPSIEEAANIPAQPNDKIKTEADKWTKTFYGAVGAVGIECAAAKETLPAGTRTARLNFSKKTTAGIISACKAQNISVTSAVHAAIAAANWAFASPEGQSKHYTSTIRAALRPYLPEQFRGPAYAAGLYTSGYMHSLPAGQTFSQNAAEYNELYRQGLSKDFIEAHRQYALNLGDLIRNTPADAPPQSGVDISSVGVVDEVVKPTHGAFEVQSISVGVEMLTRQMVCFVWTFRGKLGFNLVYNEAFYPAEVPGKFLEKVKSVLVQELGVKE